MEFLPAWRGPETGWRWRGEWWNAKGRNTAGLWAEGWFLGVDGSGKEVPTEVVMVVRMQRRYRWWRERHLLRTSAAGLTGSRVTMAVLRLPHVCPRDRVCPHCYPEGVWEAGLAERLPR